MLNRKQALDTITRIKKLQALKNSAEEAFVTYEEKIKELSGKVSLMVDIGIVPATNIHIYRCPKGHTLKSSHMPKEKLCYECHTLNQQGS